MMLCAWDPLNRFNGRALVELSVANGPLKFSICREEHISGSRIGDVGKDAF